MKSLPRVLFLGVLLLVLSFEQALAGNEFTPKVALHVSAATNKASTICSTWNPNGKGIPCSDYVAEGPLGENLLVYMVVAQADTPAFSDGIAGVSMGIEYNGNLGQGVDVYSWTLCADGQEYPNAGPRGEWPASGGGNTITWLTCQETRIGSDGMHAVVGAFGVYAYSADLLKVTPNRNLQSGPFLGFANCDAEEVRPDSISSSGWAGFGIDGRNPCGPLAVTALDVDPNTLNLGSQGNFVTAHIELSPGHDPANIDLSSLRFNAFVAASTEIWEIGDWNLNGVPDLMVKFPRDQVDAVLSEGDHVLVTITGTIYEQTFIGTTRIRVIRPHLYYPNGGESYLTGSVVQAEWENPNGWTVDHARIHYSADGGETWVLVESHVIGETYVWRAPQESTENGRLRVVLMDDLGVMGYDSSDGAFAVRAATTGIGDVIPTAYRLYPTSPNPFQSATRVAFDLPAPGRVTLKVFDLSGRIVRVLANGDYPAGNHEVSWNARDTAGELVAGGIYFLHMQSGSFTDTRRLYLQR